jgi:hypothetical protein
VADQDHAGECLAFAQIADQRGRIVDIVLEAEILGASELRLPAAGAALVIAQRRDAMRDEGIRKLFSVAGFAFGASPSWSVDPAPAISSATGGCSTSAGTDSQASMAPTRILLSSAETFAAKPKVRISAANARERIEVRNALTRSFAPLRAA